MVSRSGIPELLGLPIGLFFDIRQAIRENLERAAQ